MLTTADKSYIDRAIDKSHKKFQQDTERYLGILMEKNLDDLKLTRELIDTRPTRDEVRSMIQEEVWPFRQEMAMFREEITALRIIPR